MLAICLVVSTTLADGCFFPLVKDGITTSAWQFTAKPSY